MNEPVAVAAPLCCLVRTPICVGSCFFFAPVRLPWGDSGGPESHTCGGALPRRNPSQMPESRGPRRNSWKQSRRDGPARCSTASAIDTVRTGRVLRLSMAGVAK